LANTSLATVVRSDDRWRPVFGAAGFSASAVRLVGSASADDGSSRQLLNLGCPLAFVSDPEDVSVRPGRANPVWR